MPKKIYLKVTEDTKESFTSLVDITRAMGIERGTYEYQQIAKVIRESGSWSNGEFTVEKVMHTDNKLS
jgi:hypothetical protein